MPGLRYDGRGDFRCTYILTYPEKIVKKNKREDLAAYHSRRRPKIERSLITCARETAVAAT